MKLLNFYLILGLLPLLLVYVKSERITFPANHVETLVVFSFSEGIKNKETNKLSEYVTYFANYISLWEDKYPIYYLPMHLWFGGYDATDLLISADPENSTSALIVLVNNLEFIENITAELLKNPIGKCNDTVGNSNSSLPTLCDLINDFIDKNPKVLTKLNLVVVSDVCPDQSNFDIFNNYGEISNTKKFQSTSSFLITKDGEKVCNKELLDKINEKVFPNEKFDNDIDVYPLVDPTFTYNLEINTNPYNLFFVIDGENYDTSINFIMNFIHNSSLCKPDEKMKDPYFIMMEVNGGETRSTVVPWINFQNEDIDFEGYLRNNLNFTLKKKDDDGLATIENKLRGIYISQMSGERHQHNILFTDHLPIWLKEEIFQNSNSYQNRSLDIIFYYPPSDPDIESNYTIDFYNKAPNSILNNNSGINLHFINSTEDPTAYQFLTVCKQEVEAKPFSTTKIPKSLPWYLWAGIAVGIAIILLITANVVYWKYFANPDVFETIVRGLDLTSDEERQLKEICDKLYIDETKVLLFHDKVLGKGCSSTVVEAIIKHATNFIKPINYFEKRESAFDELPVAAKLINRLERDQIEQLYGELETTRKLQNHPNICALIGWTHQLKTIPCLLFERMNMNLQDYLISLRMPDSDIISLSESSTSRTHTLSEHYTIPDFSDVQQKIFLQILWNASKGMTYVASKGIAHRDVAARNILLKKEGEHYIAKIADFGLCCDVDEATNVYHSTTHKKLPLEWLSIEAITRQTFSQASDVWAFGIMMIEIYTLNGELYPGIRYNELKDYLEAGCRIEKPEKMKDQMYEIAFSCWSTQPSQRPTFSHLENIFYDILGDYPDRHGYEYGYVELRDEVVVDEDDHHPFIFPS